MAAAGAAPQGTFLQVRDGRFVDDRWVGGRWVMSNFNNAQGETDWDAVIDAGGRAVCGLGGGLGHSVSTQ
jgi:cytosine/adenosine deaminase-related metal-dependent hydrolase